MPPPLENAAAAPSSAVPHHGRFLRQIYASDIFADCLSTAFTNSLQIPIITNLGLRLFDNFLTSNPDDIDVRDLPDQDQAFGLLVQLGFIGGATFPTETEFPAFTPINLYFTSDTNLRITGNIADFHEQHPNTDVVTIAENTSVYHTFHGTAEDRIRFNGVRFVWGFIRIMASGAEGEPEPHYISVRTRDDHVIFDGGEEGSLVYRVASKAALGDLIFTEDGRAVLAAALGVVFNIANFELDVNGIAQNMLFIPKVVCKPISRRWDQLVTQEDIAAAVVPYPLVLDNHTPEGAPFAIRLIEANDATIVDLAM